MNINPKIFKAYDIRGLYPEEIDGESAKQIAKAYAKFLDARKVVIGHDMRHSSVALHALCVEGLKEAGVEVLDIGLSSTPMLYWATPHLEADGGIMVTASHNPINYGGLKFVDSKGAPIFVENGLLDIKKITGQDIGDLRTNGEIKNIEIKGKYIAYLEESGSDFKNYKVVIDAMHGSMGPVAEEILGRSGLEATFLSCEPDGDIPGYKTPNPSLEENRDNIKKTIVEKGADLGIMFDGDGDRVLMVDSEGELVSPNFMAALIAEEILKEEPGSRIVGDVRASHSIKDIIESMGGEYFFAKAGNPYIKDMMREKDAIFGFETTGHMMFKKSSFTEDTIMALIYLLKALSRLDKSPQKVFDDFKNKYFIIPEVNYKINDNDVLEKVAERYKDGKIDRLDGLTIEFPEYWFNIRKSNTEPVIRLNMEANSREILEEKKKEFTEFIIVLGGELADH